MRHEACARTEQGQIRSALFHQTQLIGLNGLAQFVVADFEVGHFRTKLRCIEIGNLRHSPGFQSFRGCGEVAMTINDQRFLLTHEGIQLKNELTNLCNSSGPQGCRYHGLASHKQSSCSQQRSLFDKLSAR